jgi:type II secretory pathway pseudopilin PulG
MRRRGTSLAEVLVAAAVLAVVGGFLVQAMATSSIAGARLTLGAQARRLLQQDLEQVRSGRGIPASGPAGTFAVAVITQPVAVPTLSPAPPLNIPACGACSADVVTSGVAQLTQVTITITSTVDNTVVASGTTTTPP